MPIHSISRRTSSCGTSYSGRSSSSSSRSRKNSAAIKLASRSERSRPYFSRNSTNAGYASPTTRPTVSTLNLASMVSLCRVAMAFQICEKRQSYTCPVSLEVTSNAPINSFMAAELGRTGTEGTVFPLSFCITGCKNRLTRALFKPLLVFNSNAQLSIPQGFLGLWRSSRFVRIISVARLHRQARVDGLHEHVVIVRFAIIPARDICKHVFVPRLLGDMRIQLFHGAAF